MASDQRADVPQRIDNGLHENSEPSLYTAPSGTTAGAIRQAWDQATAQVQLPDWMPNGQALLDGIAARTGRTADVTPAADVQGDYYGEPVEPGDDYRAVAQRYGLNVDGFRQPDGSIMRSFFRVNADGQKEYLHNAAGSPEDAAHGLEKYREDTIRAMEEKYNVRIRTEGTARNGEPLRAPDLWQLTTLDDSLAQSRPSISSVGARPLNVEFPERAQYAGQTFGDEGDGPAVVMAPDVRDPWSLQTVLNHEFVHVGQQRLNADFPDYEDRLGADLGFVRMPDAEGLNAWAVRGTDGNMYRHIAKHGAGTQDWVRVDAEGNIAQDGNRIFYTNNEIRALLPVTPSTEYFESPSEMIADTLAQYRRGGPDRERLSQQNPRLYEIAEKWDQFEIDNFYGTTGDGRPRRVRSDNGRLRETT